MVAAGRPPASMMMERAPPLLPPARAPCDVAGHCGGAVLPPARSLVAACPAAPTAAPAAVSLPAPQPRQSGTCTHIRRAQLQCPGGVGGQERPLVDPYRMYLGSLPLLGSLARPLPSADAPFKQVQTGCSQAPSASLWCSPHQRVCAWLAPPVARCSAPLQRRLGHQRSPLPAPLAPEPLTRGCSPAGCRQLQGLRQHLCEHGRQEEEEGHGAPAAGGLVGQGGGAGGGVSRAGKVHRPAAALAQAAPRRGGGGRLGRQQPRARAGRWQEAAARRRRQRHRADRRRRRQRRRGECRAAAVSLVGQQAPLSSQGETRPVPIRQSLQAVLMPHAYLSCPGSCHVPHAEPAGRPSGPARHRRQHAAERVWRQHAARPARRPHPGQRAQRQGAAVSHGAALP